LHPTSKPNDIGGNILGIAVNTEQPHNLRGVKTTQQTAKNEPTLKPLAAPMIIG
jgi:hypothetical protein